MNKRIGDGLMLILWLLVAPSALAGHVVLSGKFDGSEPVSYTHLTLPTICSV